MRTAVATEHEQAEDRERVGGDAEAAQPVADRAEALLDALAPAPVEHAVLLWTSE